MNAPNLLYVFADQWRWQSLGYAGNADVRTPAIDAFAAESVDLCCAVAGSPVCCPARASLLTGRFPDRHGVFLNDAPLDPELPSIGKSFAAAGYDTAWVGKWHVDGHGRLAPIPRERRQGFAYWKACECTHDYHDSRYYDHDDPEPKTWPGYDAIAQTDDLIGWLRARDASPPFCAFLSWGPPHNPYDQAPERYRERYDPAALALRDNVPEEHAEQARRDLAGYYAHCTALDDCFARLLACLDELGQREETIVVFTSDHGDFLGSHGLWDKQAPWDEALRVPFLLRWPGGGLAHGQRNETVLSTVDIFPTLAALAGLPIPDGVQGRDLSAPLRAGAVPEDNAALIAAYHSFGNWPRYAAQSASLYHAREYRGLRDPRWCYVEDREGPWLLYDCDADPLQLHNLVDDPAHAQRRERFGRALHARLATQGDEFLSGMAYVERWGYAVDERGTMSTA